MKLSILDFVSIYEGVSDQDTLLNMIETVKIAEKLGFKRYWFTEHHAMKTLMSTSPELMIALAGTHTSRIRLGAGGIMLPNHSALKVAENFKILETMFPNRIDLGLGRAPGTNPRAALALARSQEIHARQDFQNQLDDLQAYFTGPDMYSKIELPGNDNVKPEIIMLGSSHGGVNYALRNKLPYVFAGHISPDLMFDVLKHYHKEKPSEEKGMFGIAAVAAIVAKTSEEAHRLSLPYELMWAQRLMGRMNVKRMSIEEAQEYKPTLEEMNYLRIFKKKLIVGSLEEVKLKLEEIITETHVEEIMIVDSYPDFESKIEAYELLSTLIS